MTAHNPQQERNNDPDWELLHQHMDAEVHSVVTTSGSPSTTSSIREFDRACPELQMPTLNPQACCRSSARSARENERLVLEDLELLLASVKSQREELAMAQAAFEEEQAVSRVEREALAAKVIALKGEQERRRRGDDDAAAAVSDYYRAELVDTRESLRAEIWKSRQESQQELQRLRDRLRSIQASGEHERSEWQISNVILSEGLSSITDEATTVTSALAGEISQLREELAGFKARYTSEAIVPEQQQPLQQSCSNGRAHAQPHSFPLNARASDFVPGRETSQASSKVSATLSPTGRYAKEHHEWWHGTFHRDCEYCLQNHRPW